MTKEQECLIKAVEQTVRKYEDIISDILKDGSSLWAECSCGLCHEYQAYGCKDCPVYKNQGRRTCHNKSTKLGITWNKAVREYDIESCLAIMVYVWGFVNFGEEFDK